MLSGDNGLLKRAGDARDDTIVGQEKEQVELAYISAAVKKLGKDVDEEDLRTELNNSVGAGKTTVTNNGDDTLNVNFTDTKHNYTVDGGTVTRTADGEIEIIPDDIFVALYNDGTLVFSNNESAIDSSKITVEYGNIKDELFSDNSTPWMDNSDIINSAEILNKIKPTTLRCWYRQLSNLTEIKNIDNINTSNVTSMQQMFYNCTGLTSLNLSGFNTKKVTAMDCMFYGCENLNSLNVSGLNTSSVTDMAEMFSGCSSLTTLDLVNFDTSAVKHMPYMFYECINLSSLNISSFDTSNVIQMEDMFQKCSSLTNLDLSSFNTSRVTNMNSMFDGCASLTRLDLSSFDTSSVIDTNRMFRNCSNLITIYASNTFVTTNITSTNNHRYMFNGCTSLVGGNGTVYNSSYIDKTYARIDTASTPGYFTLKTN